MLGIIGGSGLYALENLENVKQHDVKTPFGTPSAPVIEGKLNSQNLFFIARHGQSHQFLPSEVNYRANIYALKSLGVTTVLSVSATGSLREDYRPGDMCLVAQYFDHTRGKREPSFFGSGVSAHVSMARAACPVLTSDVEKAAKNLGLVLHVGATYACVEGPRLGTRAESFFLRDAKCDLVGMTNVPEAFLAREAQMGYLTLAIVTDYDCWKDDPDEHASVEEVFATYKANIEKVKNILNELCQSEISETPDWIRNALKGSVLTPDSALSNDQKAWLNVLRS